MIKLKDKGYRRNRMDCERGYKKKLEMNDFDGEKK